MIPGTEHLMPMRMQIECLRVDRAIALWGLAIWGLLDTLVWLLG